MEEGLIIFTSHRVEQKVMDCLGFSPVQNTGRIEHGYMIQKFNVKGATYFETVIRANDVLGRAKRLQQSLGGIKVLIFSTRDMGHADNVQVISSVSDVAAALQVVLTPVECSGLQEVLGQHQPTATRNRVNPERIGDAEQEFSNQFFSAVRAGQHMPAPDPDLFQGAVFFNPSSDRITIVQTNNNNNNSSDEELRMALELSMHYPQPIHDGEESPEKKKRRRSAPPSWESILKEPEPIVPGQPVCITCPSHRASICFIPCGHQVMCDLCVRQMCELPGVRRACPYCRDAPDSILRPITSEVEK